MFDERELELLIGGIADIDVEDWKKHTDYRGYTETDEVIVNFWKVGGFFDWFYPDFLTIFFAVRADLGCRAEITIVAVHYRNVPYPCQRLQGSPGK